MLGIVKTMTLFYLPQSDGLVEHFNQTLLTMLATAGNAHLKSIEHRYYLLMAYNASVHPSTGCMLFYLHIWASDSHAH